MRYNARMDTILTGDCVIALATMSAGVVDLAFADPPFNLGLRTLAGETRREPQAGPRSSGCCQQIVAPAKENSCRAPFPTVVQPPP
jgi:hypothetical protein